MFEMQTIESFNRHPRDYVSLTDKRIQARILEDMPGKTGKNGMKFSIFLANTRKSMSILSKDSLYSAVLPRRYLENHFDGLIKMKDEGIPLMTDHAIIKRSNYNRATDTKAGLCREYNLNPQNLLDWMLFAHSLGLSLHVDGNLKNPVTNHSASLPDSSPELSVVLNPLSPLYAVMSHNFKNVVGIKKIEEYCVERYKKLLFKRSNSRKMTERRYVAELKSIANDYQKYVAMFFRGLIDPATQIFHYKKRFSVSSTGRLCEIDGGLQGLTRGCKAYLYNGVANVFNYDIRACQLTLLSHYGKEMKINTKWIDEYVACDDAKKVYAKRVGISVDAWKKTILSMVFGGSATSYGTPYQTILKDKGGNRALAEACFTRWQQETEGLRVICKLWLTRIKKWAIKNSSKGILENAAGVQIDITDKTITKKFLSSFILQGLESRIISEIILYPNADYEVVSPEYDGIVSYGKIDQSVWSNILIKLNLTESNLVLEEKPFG